MSPRRDFKFAAEWVLEGSWVLLCVSRRGPSSGAAFALAGSAKEIDRSRWRERTFVVLRGVAFLLLTRSAAPPLKGRRKPAVGSSAMKVGLRVVRRPHRDLRIVDVVRKG
jgi:hypothetical protein